MTFDPAARGRHGALPLAGIELGGTKCVCTLAHGPDAILAQETVPTEHPAVTLPAIAAILQKWWDAGGFAALGIASFGPVDLDPSSPTWGHILATTKPDWPMTDVAGALSSGFDVPVAFDTDVNGAAFAEVLWGCAKGLDDFAYVTIGTGVGVGLLVNGKPTRGIGHAEIGHLRVPRLATDTLPSGCPFHDDCVEGLASGTGIKAALGDVHVSTLANDHPVWDRVESAITAMCHAMVCTTGPKRIAIGGGVMNKQPHLLARIEPALRASINGYLPLPERDYVVAPALGDQAGPMGSIALAQVALAERVAA
ncbi:MULTISPECIES: ROK family protein [Sphingomonas]|uniref:fructokinase n=1 Tax=Sphingomonas hankookensis TaxID=563996 RepID=A0ABR5YAV4_9SPHN|nr:MULTISPECIES: ROK family protein [Sphingomonas]KZE11767.1 fructokinase [Sphingomonas hankookensis]PZT92552.1 MAG: fructokinase [Sphingomonas sp.]